MRSILHTLPIRWQIPALYAAILALVLAAGGVAVWNAQRAFQYDGLLARQLTEMRGLIPEELDIKLETWLYAAEKPDPATLKMRHTRLMNALLPPGEDPAVALKRIALLNPKLVDQLFPAGADLPSYAELHQMMPKVVDQLFPPDEDARDTRKKLMDLDPKLAADLFPELTVDQLALRKYAVDLAEKASAKDRGVAILALDGTVLAQSSAGPACVPALVSKAAVADKAGAALFDKLRTARYVDSIDHGQLTMVLPLIWQNNRPLALAQGCVPTDSIDASLNQLALSLIVGWALVVGLATALGVTVTRRVLRPLDQVIATSGQIAAGDLRRRVGLPPGRGEIARLGAAFDAMVERLEAAFAAQRRFVADAAHELRTPLTALSASVELLRMGAADSDPATARRLLRHLDGELSRVIRLTNDLLTLSRLDARPLIDPRPLDLSTLLEEVGEQSRALLSGQSLLIDVAPGLGILGDADRLRQVVLNLLDNARKYTPAGGRIVLRASSECAVMSSELPISDGSTARSELKTYSRDISTQNSKLRTHNWVVVEVQDTGVGIPSEALPHLFERFYRVDNARARASGGSGLGLAIVQAIVVAHGGLVAVESAPSTGTRVMIRLPWQPTTATATSPMSSDGRLSASIYSKEQKY
jgi:two-component system OmpR family sensor kinase